MNKIKSLAPIIIFMIGAGIFLYPTIANSWAVHQQAKVITNYEDQLKMAEQMELEQYWKSAQIYNENLAGDPVHDPFVPNSGYALPDNYTSVLNMGDDGIMGYIEIPKISVNLPIYHGTSDEVLADGVGHIEGTSLPIGGNFRHSVLCAHRGLPSAELFSRLDEIEKGDLFYIHVLDEILAYRVDAIDIVLPEEITPFLYAKEGNDWITLMTCTPIGQNTHRILVRGTRTEYIPEKKEEIKDTNSKAPLYISLAVTILLIFCILILRTIKRWLNNHV